MPVIGAHGCPLWVAVEGPQHFRVMRYDRRGHGRSGVPAVPYTMERLGPDALAIADRLELKTFNWCGLSGSAARCCWHTQVSPLPAQHQSVNDSAPASIERSAGVVDRPAQISVTGSEMEQIA